MRWEGKKSEFCCFLLPTEGQQHVIGSGKGADAQAADAQAAHAASCYIYSWDFFIGLPLTALFKKMGHETRLRKLGHSPVLTRCSKLRCFIDSAFTKNCIGRDLVPEPQIH